MQLTLEFTSRSKINTEKLSRQNRIVFNHLSLGHTINTVQAREEFYIYNLHSRISDLRNDAGVIIFDRTIKVGESNVKEYSLKQFEKK